MFKPKCESTEVPPLKEGIQNRQENFMTATNINIQKYSIEKPESHKLTNPSATTHAFEEIELQTTLECYHKALITIVVLCR